MRALRFEFHHIFLLFLVSAGNALVSPLIADPIAVDIQTWPLDVPRLLWSHENPRSTPVGAPVWLVADRAKDGMFPDNQVDRKEIKRMIGGESDNLLVFVGISDGALLGDQIGKIVFHGIPIQEPALLQADFHIIVWQKENYSKSVGELGDQFGLLKLGAIENPEVGNAVLLIDQDIYTDQFIVTDIEKASTPFDPLSLSTIKPTDSKPSELTFADWNSEYFGNVQMLSIRSEYEDPDEDGIPNGLEYLMGSNPLIKNPRNLYNSIQFAKSDSTYFLPLLIRKNRPSVHLEAHCSPDLVQWERYIGPSKIIEVDDLMEEWIYRFPFPNQKGFIRFHFSVDSTVH